MYKLVYYVNGVQQTVYNRVYRVLTELTKGFVKGTTWKIYNQGGVLLSSNDE